MKAAIKFTVRQAYYLALMITASWALDYFNWVIKKVPLGETFKHH